MTNLDFLRPEPQFSAFAETVVAAEHILHIDPAACVVNCRRTMELAVRWVYSADSAFSPDRHRRERQKRESAK